MRARQSQPRCTGGDGGGSSAGQLQRERLCLSGAATAARGRAGASAGGLVCRGALSAGRWRLRWALCKHEPELLTANRVIKELACERAGLAALLACGELAPQLAARRGAGAGPRRNRTVSGRAAKLEAGERVGLPVIGRAHATSAPPTLPARWAARPSVSP